MNRIFVFLVLLVFAASSCKEEIPPMIDPCAEVNCNNGECLDGTCLCDDGFEGVNCDKEEREKFYGSWTGDIDCGTGLGSGEATVNVSEDPNDSSAILFDLDLGLDGIDSPLEPVTGTVVGNRIFITSDTQTVMFGEYDVEVTVGGQGELNDDETLDMQITVGIQIFGSFECMGILTKE